MHKLVSVIIPTYGRADELEIALRSVSMQTYSNIEVIVVDDNTCIEYSSKVKKTILIFYDILNILYLGDGINRGGSGARNLGIEKSNGFYITFLDDDDFFEKEKIEMQVKHLEDGGLDVSVCDMFFIKEGKSLDVNNCYARVNSLKDFIKNGNCYTSMILAKKDVLISANGFTETPRFQDHILMLKILAITDKVERLEKKLFTHNYHFSERITNKKNNHKGWIIRLNEESKYLEILDRRELQEYNFDCSLIKLKVLRNENNFKELVINTIKLLLCTRNFKQFKNFTKTLIRNIFLPRRHF